MNSKSTNQKTQEKSNFCDNSTVFLNDKFVAYKNAFVHIEDRGFQFGDGIYEVVLFENNKLIDFDNHIKRLFRSAGELNLKIEKTAKDFEDIFLKLFAKNKLTSGYVYLQITRGTHSRIQTFPKNCQTTINAIVRPLKIIDQKTWKSGFKVITHEDIRWKRCDIKSIALLASTMMREKAEDQNACEAVLIRDGFVTEGSFSNVFIVNDKNQLITREAGNYILQGITRNRVISLAKENGIEIIEEKFNKEDLLNAKEVFLTSSTLKIRPVSQIDDHKIGDNKIGEITKKLHELYENYLTSHQNN